ncbi:unnamed protein product, partial [Didymodactylos carnosus]
QIETIQLSTNDRDHLESLITRPLALIVCSQNYSGKARLVNELLHEQLLPEPPDVTKDDIVRMIRIKHNPSFGASLTLFGCFELLDTDNLFHDVSWKTVPKEELMINDSDDEYTNGETATFEIRKPIDLLIDDLQIVVTPSNQKRLNMEQIYIQITEAVTPVFIYVIDEETLSENDTDDLRRFRAIVPNEPILFIRSMDDSNNKSRPKMSEISLSPGFIPRTKSETTCVHIFRQLCDLGFLSMMSTETTDPSEISSPLFESDMIDGCQNFPLLLTYIRKHLDRLCIRAAGILQRSHELSLDLFNNSAFDMARDILITPKRISYAREKEKNLYESLIALTNSKQSEIQRVILQAADDMREHLTDQAAQLDIAGIELSDDLTVRHSRDLKKCTSVIQEFVLIQLNQTIANKLIDSIEVLRESYIGTLTRCLRSLEMTEEDLNEQSASKALQGILQSAYQVNITVSTSSNLFKILIEKMKELFRTFHWSSSPRIDPQFKQSVALNILDGLSESKQSVCTQLNDRIRMSHDSFEHLLKQLENRHNGRLQRTEEKQQRVRKELTPKIARLELESTSLKDLIQYGMPVQGREIGRGQYGVVYACESWANERSCVIKSVVPPDDKHWNDLALEFHYLRRIPDHPRVARLIGSVIESTDRDQSAVLLVLERLKRDLYAALKNGIDFLIRMRIALDVVEGLRYLHGLGLVHRDIKLKNVLLDETNRARLTDLGFCKPEVMMSGSLVGTPIHMAPELFTLKYDHTVDIYAFGILLWYICSNSVKLPTNFDVCGSCRPERLMNFDDDCWQLMTRCWDHTPANRPYLGEVQAIIERVYEKYASATSSTPPVLSTTAT